MSCTRIAHRVARTFLKKKAGASEFDVFVRGTNADKAFKSAVKYAEDDSGRGGYSGTIAEKSEFTLIQRTPVSREEANEIVARTLDDNDKWGPAFALPIAESKVIMDKSVTVKVQAKTALLAQEAAKAQVQAKIKAKPGATLVIEPKWVAKPTKLGGQPEVETKPGKEGGFAISTRKPPRVEKLYPSKKEALHAFVASSYDLRVGLDFFLWKVTEVSSYKITGEATKLPTWEIPVSIKQVKTGAILGYRFYGLASS